MRIPDFTALGTNNPQAVGPAKFTNSGSLALASAVGNVANDIGDIADTQYKRQANLALATADSETIKGLLDLQDKIKSTDNYNDWQSEFDKQAPQVTQRVRSNLMGPETQGIYDVSVQDHLLKFSTQMDDAATKRREDVQRGGLAQLLQDNREVYGRAPDDQTRQQILQSTNEAITAASAPAPGRGPLIDPDVSVKMKRDFVDGVAKDYIQSLPADQAISVLGASIPGRLRGEGTQGPAADATDIWGAIHKQESGGSSTSRTSVDGAVGGAQILPQTFAQYAQPGEKITNPADNIAVGQRIVADYTQKYGGDPARVAVAYFSGPGNVAPPGSPTPYIKDYRDGNGKSVSSYVSDVTRRLGVSDAGNVVDMPAAKTGTPVDFLPVADRIQLYHGAIADQRQARVLAAQADMVSNHKTQNDFLGRLTQGTLTTKDVLASDLPPFGQGSKDEFINLIKTNSGTEPTLGPGFWDVYTAVIAPPGTPNRITDQSQLYSLAGPGKPLTLSGVAELTKIMSGKGTPSGEAESQMQHQFFENARHQITGSNEGLHLVDPKGDEQFLKFQAHAFADIQAKKAKGLTATQIYNPESPDYVGKSISGFTRPMSEWTADIVNDAGVSAPGFDPTSLKTLPDIVAAVKAGKLPRAAGIALARQHGLLADDAPPVPMGGGGH